MSIPEREEYMILKIKYPIFDGCVDKVGN